jgi:predicted MFS family arabinose efflux permease
MTRIFVGFACAYFLAALLRAVTATLAPTFSAELGLQAADLGLLAGAYFFGFAAMQMPLGQALDRFGPRRVLLVLTSLAVLGCVAFALATSMPVLLAARALIGIGLAAGLMAPLTCFRHRFPPAAQLRANSWMLMTGSLGMVASTLPVQGLLPVLGWRGLFAGLALALAAAMALIVWLVPRDDPCGGVPHDAAAGGGYGPILRHPMFLRLAPLAVLQYGGLIAVQSLWAGPWLTTVAGLSAERAAAGLFAINLAMLFAYLAWGTVMPRLAARGVPPLTVVRAGVPLALALLAGAVWRGPDAGAAHWAAWCVAGSCLSISQPALAQAFAPAQAGRALSAYNLLIFVGVFGVQWSVGLGVDALVEGGAAQATAFRIAFGGLGLLCALAYAWFLWRGRA